MKILLIAVAANLFFATSTLADDKELTITQSDLTQIINAAVAQARAQDAAALAKPAIDKVQKQIAPPQKEPMKDDKK